MHQFYLLNYDLKDFKNKKVNFMNLKICFLIFFLISTLSFAETVKTNAFSGKVINKTDILNEKLSWYVNYSIDGYQPSVYGSQYKIFGQKNIISVPDKSGNYAIKSVKLSCNDELTLKKNIAFTINYPEKFFINSVIQNVGSLSFYPSPEYLNGDKCDFELRKQLIQLDFSNLIQTISDRRISNRIRFTYEIIPDTIEIQQSENNYSELSMNNPTKKAFGDIWADFNRSDFQENTTKSLLVFCFIPSVAGSLFERFRIYTNLPNTMGGENEIMVFSNTQETELKKMQDTVKISFLNHDITNRLKRILDYRDTLLLLSNAIDSGNVIICRHLFKNGLSPNTLDDVGYPFFIRAIQKSNESIVKEFVGAGVNVNCKSASGAVQIGESALGFALGEMHRYRDDTTANEQARHILDLLLDRGAHDSSLVDKAVRAKYLPALKAIVKQGGNINEQTRGGLSTVLFDGIETGDLEVVRLLVENGADLKLKPTDSYYKQTCLGLAKRMGNDKIVQYLISVGAH
jgi:hypothetical protein